ncbi:MAG TPA: metal ABC transporter substrate-binding protein [Bacillota bacterium]
MGYRRLPALTVVALVFWVAGCGAFRPSQPPDQEPVRAVTTVYALADFTRAVGGDRVAVEQLAPEGGHGHEHEPTPRDLEKILNADLFIYNGAAFEPWIDQVLGLIEGADGVRPVDASRGIALLAADDPGGADGHPGAGAGPRSGLGAGTRASAPVPDVHGVDPHVWLDPRRAAQQVAVIAEALTAVDPGGEAGYRAGAEAFRAQLEELDRHWTEGLAGCRLRDFVVDHGAFGYIADRYGLHQVAVTGLAADQPPTPGRLAGLTAFVVERGIRVLFYDPGSGAGAVRALAVDTGTRLLPLHPLETPAAGEAQRGENYLTIMRANLEALQQGLECGGDGRGEPDHGGR